MTDEIGTGPEPTDSGPRRNARRRRVLVVAAALAVAVLWLAAGPGGLDGMLSAGPQPAAEPAQTAGPPGPIAPTGVGAPPAGAAQVAASRSVGMYMHPMVAALPRRSVPAGAATRARCDWAAPPERWTPCVLWRRAVFVVPAGARFADDMRDLHDALTGAGWKISNRGLREVAGTYEEWARAGRNGGPAAARRHGDLSSAGYVYGGSVARLDISWLDSASSVDNLAAYDHDVMFERNDRPVDPDVILDRIPPGGYAVMFDIELPYSVRSDS